MNAIDRLFNEQLEGHSTTPSSEAWERIETRLNAGTNPRAWIRWAAVLLPAIAAAGIWMSRPAEEASIAVKPAQVQPVTPIGTEPVQRVEVKVNERPAVAKAKTIRHQQPVAVAAPNVVAEPDLPIAAVTLLPESAPLEELTIEPIIETVETVAIAPQTQPLVIVYTLDPVVEAAAEKPSSIARVVEFARSVKHSDPIGDLRGLKDELLALDLRKKSTKKN